MILVLVEVVKNIKNAVVHNKKELILKRPPKVRHKNLTIGGRFYNENFVNLTLSSIAAFI
jgi:hypothetical protein